MTRSKSKPIRVPRTTALFIVGLARILREHFMLNITEHEHWTLREAGHWEECGYPGECQRHGVSTTAIEKMYNEKGVRSFYDFIDRSSFTPCMPYVMTAYVGTGEVGTRTGKVQLRVHIEHMYAEWGDHVYTVRVWIRDTQEAITNAEFGLHDDGHYYLHAEKCPALPPNSIAFWNTSQELIDAS